jgi:hypothetical protein
VAICRSMQHHDFDIILLITSYVQINKILKKNKTKNKTIKSMVWIVTFIIAFLEIENHYTYYFAFCSHYYYKLLFRMLKMHQTRLDLYHMNIPKMPVDAWKHLFQFYLIQHSVYPKSVTFSVLACCRHWTRGSRDRKLLHTTTWSWFQW